MVEISLRWGLNQGLYTIWDWKIAHRPYANEISNFSSSTVGNSSTFLSVLSKQRNPCWQEMDILPNQTILNVRNWNKLFQNKKYTLVHFVQTYLFYNTLKVPQISKLGFGSKHNINKWLKINTKFIIWRPVEMTRNDMIWMFFKNYSYLGLQLLTRGALNENYFQKFHMHVCFFQCPYLGHW